MSKRELRRDYFTDKLVLVGKGPPGGSSKILKPDKKKSKACPFCPGNEKMTPPADIALVEREGSLIKMSDEDPERVKGWVVRAFPNESPVVTPDSSNTFSEPPIYSEPALGYDYVFVVTPEHSLSFSKFDINQWTNILSCVQDKMKWFYSQKGVAYVVAYINYGVAAGAEQPHPHLRMISLPRLPPLIEAEAAAVQQSMRTWGSCPMCTIVNLESGGPRHILSTDHFISFCPWASSHSFEFWIFPKRHQTSFLRLSQKEINDLSLMIRSTLGGLARSAGDVSFNLIFHTSSEKKTTKQIHWHIEVYPRIKDWAALERGVGIFVNETSPEDAAEILQKDCKKELAEVLGIS